MCKRACGQQRRSAHQTISDDLVDAFNGSLVRRCVCTATVLCECTNVHIEPRESALVHIVRVWSRRVCQQYTHTQEAPCGDDKVAKCSCACLRHGRLL